MDPEQAKQMIDLLTSIDSSLLKLIELKKTNVFGLTDPSMKHLKDKVEGIISTVLTK